ncbi:DUF5776 domain-containing protein [Levilactobacillus tujiorum]|uniref:DUF5776 domain-containing protein n=1 Tax=Levilactobacillus tujiorum TaxID=2912243 RepID=UPI00145739F2|nr:DUF5776 domain-containing protein [Levilactobacillus tujiorum]NLR30950.1 BspA family leucine-rich repeat surface protein [Levilactobacillus tujiorum]
MKRGIVSVVLATSLALGGVVLLENSPGVASWTPMIVAHADTPQSGKLGSCDYTLSDGVLHIGAGTLPEAAKDTGVNPMYPKVSPFFPLIYGVPTAVKAISFDGKVQTPPDASYLFINLSTSNSGKNPSAAPQIRNWQNLDTSQTTNMAGMLRDSGQQTIDVSAFDTSQVTNMSEMFRSNENLTGNIIGLNSGKFDTSHVTNMTSMFYAVGNDSFQLTLDLSGFDVGQIEPGGFNGMLSPVANAQLAVNFSNWHPQVPLDSIFSGSLYGDCPSQLTLNGNLDLSNAGLAEIYTDPTEENPTYTGNWENMDDRYHSDKETYSSADLMAKYGSDASKRPQGNRTYIWEPEVLPIQGKPVTVHYMDEAGTTLQADLILTGDAEEPYTITPPEIKGYEYVEDPDVQLTGKYSATDSREVTLIYKLLPTPPVTPTTPGTSTDSSSDSSSESETSPDEANSLPVARKDRAITAVKKLGLYRTPDFSKKTRQFYYAKQTRTKRPQFVITGVAQSKNGTKRYVVRDVTANSKRYGKTGYITARKAFTVHTYYQSTPKTVKVIGAKGVNAYRSVSLKGKVKHYKRGTVLRVKAIKRHNLTTRLQLTNGAYLTANKNLIIQK